MAVHWDTIISDFPQLQRRIHGKRLAYLDNAATTLKPQCVIDAVNQYNAHGSANIHRGVHLLSVEASELYENTRAIVQKMIHCQDEKEVIFTGGTTLAINMLAQMLGESVFKAGDEIILTAMEHHSNLVPWQMLAKRMGVVLKFVPFSLAGELDLDAYESLLSEKTRLVSVVHVSNSLGTINPVSEMVSMAKKYGALTLIDAAQSIAHEALDVEKLGCDFLVFSGHKVFAPTGVGVLWGRKALLQKLAPAFGGGSMIQRVTLEETTYAGVPERFEAGTPPIAEVIGLGEALKYVMNIGVDTIHHRESQLLAYAEQKLTTIDGLKIIGRARNKAAILSLILDDVHPHDVGTMLDHAGVAIRAGHHCTQPVMDFYGIPATTRASLAFYNTMEDIDQLYSGLLAVREMFR